MTQTGDYSILVGGHQYSVPKDIYDICWDMSSTEFMLLAEVDDRIHKIY